MVIFPALGDDRDPRDASGEDRGEPNGRRGQTLAGFSRNCACDSSQPKIAQRKPSNLQRRIQRLRTFYGVEPTCDPRECGARPTVSSCPVEPAHILRPGRRKESLVLPVLEGMGVERSDLRMSWTFHALPQQEGRVEFPPWKDPSACWRQPCGKREQWGIPWSD